MLFRVLPFDGSTTHFRVNAVFVSRSRRSLLFCFLILFFTIYFFIRFSPYLFAVCLAFEYMTIIKPFFRTAKLFEKKNLERSKNSLFANMERTRAKWICKWLNINKIEKMIFFEKNFSFAKIKKAPFQRMYKIKISFVYWLSDY